jgi:hypothetical protein
MLAVIVSLKDFFYCRIYGLFPPPLLDIRFIHLSTMQQFPPILPPPALPDGTEAPPRSPERQANLIKFQSELEACHTSTLMTV